MGPNFQLPHLLLFVPSLHGGHEHASQPTREGGSNSLLPLDVCPFHHDKKKKTKTKKDFFFVLKLPEKKLTTEYPKYSLAFSEMYSNFPFRVEMSKNPRKALHPSNCLGNCRSR